MIQDKWQIRVNTKEKEIAITALHQSFNAKTLVFVFNYKGFLFEVPASFFMYKILPIKISCSVCIAFSFYHLHHDFMCTIRKLSEAWAWDRDRSSYEVLTSKPGPTINLLWSLSKKCIHSLTGKVFIITGSLTASWFYWGLINYAGIALNYDNIWEIQNYMEDALPRWEIHKSSVNDLHSLESVIISSFCLKICSEAPPSCLDYWCQHLIYRQLRLGWDAKKTEEQHGSSREPLSKPKTDRQHRIPYKSQHTGHLHYQQRQRQSAITLQHTAGGFAYLSFQIVISTQAASTNQDDRVRARQVEEKGWMNARAGCEMQEMYGEWGENFTAVVCGREAVRTPF